MHAARMLHDVEIDWGWRALDGDERAIALRYEARLQADRRAHTTESVEAMLDQVARELPNKLVRARAVDDERRYGWQIVEGDVYPCDEFDENGMFPGELTAENFHAVGVTSVVTPLAFPESMLREIKDRGPLSALVQGAWHVAADELPAGFRAPSGPSRMQTIPLPVELWAQIKDRAKAEQRTMSYLVQRAVTAAYALSVD
jgi:hypothetical protein